MDILEYHRRTRHRPDAYARGPESIDWDAQPNPFRNYVSPDQAGRSAAQIPLPLAATADEKRWYELWQAPPATPLQPDIDRLAAVLELSLALSACKQAGAARWSLRVNPSSGNLHPTECYVVACNIGGLEDGIYHYRADTHALEQRCRFREKSTGHEPVLWLGFSSVHWREAWKYGERAYRYCQLDSGHALAAVSYAAAVTGFAAGQLVVQDVTDQALAGLLGIARHDDFIISGGAQAERENADCLLSLSGRQGLDYILCQARQGDWYGRANILDSRHFYDWPLIEDAARCSSRNQIEDSAVVCYPQRPPPRRPSGLLAGSSAAQLIRQRRSAQQFDPAGSMRADDFFTLLDHCLPRPDYPPWNSLQAAADIHLFIFVHNVDGLESGLYALLREPSVKETLMAATRSQFIWQTVPQAPQGLMFFQLLKAAARRTAANLSCQQAIAGDSAFSLAMLADMQAVAGQPWLYRQRFWQAGAIGQVLYLDAEAAGLRGTGIGCYYDEFVHDLLGLQDERWQVLYHFTVGKPLTDPRITSWSPYQERRGK
ncbi:MAG: SagB/ThcOx family dehydrogenase [Pseudomonadota bacterium]|nr:SagB/ThcOx family dehydrogenase [Pseudomonadota bacterium]